MKYTLLHSIQFKGKNISLFPERHFYCVIWVFEYAGIALSLLLNIHFFELSALKKTLYQTSRFSFSLAGAKLIANLLD